MAWYTGTARLRRATAWQIFCARVSAGIFSGRSRRAGRGRPRRGRGVPVVQQQPVKGIDVVGTDPVTGRGLGLRPGAAFEVHDADCGDDIKREALVQIVDVIEAMVFDPQAGLEESEVRFDDPAPLVPVQEDVGIVVFGGTDGTQGDRHGLIGVFGGHQGDGGGAGRSGPFAPTGGQGQGTGVHHRLLGEVTEQALGRAVVQLNPASAGPTGADQQGMGLSGGLVQQGPEIALTVTHGNDSGGGTGLGQCPGAVQAALPTAAFDLALWLRSIAKGGLEGEHPERATGVIDSQSDMGQQALHPFPTAERDQAGGLAMIRIVQGGGILDRENDRRGGGIGSSFVTVAFDGALDMGLQYLVGRIRAVPSRPTGRVARRGSVRAAGAARPARRRWPFGSAVSSTPPGVRWHADGAAGSRSAGPASGPVAGVGRVDIGIGHLRAHTASDPVHSPCQ